MKYLLLGAFIFVSVYAIALKYDQDIILINKKIDSLAEKQGYTWNEGHMIEPDWEKYQLDVSGKAYANYGILNFPPRQEQ